VHAARSSLHGWEGGCVLRVCVGGGGVGEAAAWEGGGGHCALKS
jgi:hypothetical protein